MKQICINLLLQKNNISFIERISMKYLIVIILLIGSFLSMFSETNNLKLKADSLYASGKANQRAMESDKALIRLNQALELYEQLDARKEIGNTLNKIGLIFGQNWGNWPKAEVYWNRALKIKKELNNKKEFKFLFVTKDQGVLRLALKNRGYRSDEIIITASSRKDVPKYIALCNTSVFFIKPSFSKKASAATKMAEIMAMGRPVITNIGWGDVEPILNDTLAGVLVKSLDAKGYNHAAQELLETKFNTDKIRQDAEKYFSLARGVEKYAGIYSKLLSNH